jgi:hypothetical protein
VAEQNHGTRGNTPALSLDEIELCPDAKPKGRPEPRGHRQDPIIDVRLRRTRNRKALATLGATALQDLLAILRSHLHEKAVGPPATAAIGLKRALHGTPSRLPRTPEKPES